MPSSAVDTSIVMTDDYLLDLSWSNFEIIE